MRIPLFSETTLFKYNVSTILSPIVDSENIVSKHFYSFLHLILFKLQLVYFLVVYHFQNVSAKSVWKVSGTRLFGSFQWKTSGSNLTSEKVVLFFRMDQTEIRVPFLQRHLHTVSRLCGLFSVNEGKRVSGTKLTSPEFCLPFVQTVNRPVCPCKW